ncbi:MAG TPA: 3-oxoacyl-ACP synthase III, partial [Pirellulaceae bacterium]
MLFDRVAIAALGYVLPARILTSQALEERLAPAYERLRLSQGRLELITGVAERRVWDPGTLPSDKSTVAAGLAVQAAEVDLRQIGAL